MCKATGKPPHALQRQQGAKNQGLGGELRVAWSVRRFAVLRDDDLVEAMAEHGGKKLILQALQQQR